MGRALVFGLGRSGKAAKALLERDGYEVVALDDGGQGLTALPTANSPLPTTNCQLPTANLSLAVVSPGIALTHPWIVEAKRRGIPIKSELQLGCEALKRQGWKLLAVTGSKGKSSVVKVVADAINLSGNGTHGTDEAYGKKQAVACGNYGVPVCEVALGKLGITNDELGMAEFPSFLIPHSSFVIHPRWAVVEVSSFMMETTELAPDTFEAAAILNLQEDHLDRHGSVEVYHGLKRKLLRFARTGGRWEARQVEGGRLKMEQRNDSKSSVQPPTTNLQPLYSGSYFDNEILRSNGAMAVELMRVAGLDDATIARAFRAFEPLPHRMQTVGIFNGVRYVDDSKATSISALIAGITMASARSAVQPPTSNLQPCLRLIAGGLAKGDDPRDALPRLTERVKKVYLIGDCAEKFFAAWSGSVDCEICGTLERAAEAAMREAGQGETVLLSPGTASFDQFKSFGERGDVFARLVKRKEKTNEEARSCARHCCRRHVNRLSRPGL